MTGSLERLGVLCFADDIARWPARDSTWTDSLLSRGYRQADIDAFLEHDPFEDQVQYQLRFVDERFIVQAIYDDRPLVTLHEGTFTVDGDGVARFVEVTDGVEGSCVVTAAAEIDGSRLLLDVLDLSVCDTDPAMANTLFFDIATYERADD